MKKYLMTLALLLAPAVTMWGQKASEKFSTTTQMFLNELKQQEEKPTAGPRRAAKRRLPDDLIVSEPQRLIASPDTVAGVAYIQCFIHLKDAGDLDAVRALGVEVQETFDGLDFVTARVPVKQLNALADIDNVTQIKVSRLMRPATDEARRQTNVSDILTLSPDAITAGIISQFDGTGVVLGVIDSGIDFQHIAFKDKDGNSRIKRAYVYCDGSGTEYTEITDSEPTTDNPFGDHGTHTSSTAGGSSVIVGDDQTVTVTDDHANATYGGMAPGTDLYLAGIDDMSETGLMNALKNIVAYADEENKPLVVSNSWGNSYGPHDGTGEMADYISQHFGDSHPNRIILFASGNGAGSSKNNENGGLFMRKSDASSETPLGSIIRSATYSNTDAGYAYRNLMATAWSSDKLDCKLYVLDSFTGEIQYSNTFTQDTILNDIYVVNAPEDTTRYYEGDLEIWVEYDNDYGKYHVGLYSPEGISTTADIIAETPSGSRYYFSNYTLAIEVYPESGSASVDMWANDDCGYFSGHLTTEGHTWTGGTDDMSVCEEPTFPNVISVGAYVSKTNVENYLGTDYSYSSGALGDIADFSSYALAEFTPTGTAYPTITAPGAEVVAGVNHFHTADMDAGSYYNNIKRLAVNNADNPYGVEQGTSMATPVAAGIVALWLQAAQSVGKDLTANDVMDIMQQTAINDEFTTTGPNASHFGYGKIDAYKGVLYILGIPTAIPELSQQQPKGVKFRLEGRTLYIDGADDGTAIRIYTTDGRLVASGPLAGGRISLPADSPTGIYAVQVGKLGSTLIRL